VSLCTSVTLMAISTDSFRPEGRWLGNGSRVSPSQFWMLVAPVGVPSPLAPLPLAVTSGPILCARHGSTISPAISLTGPELVGLPTGLDIGICPDVEIEACHLDRRPWSLLVRAPTPPPARHQPTPQVARFALGFQLLTVGLAGSIPAGQSRLRPLVVREASPGGWPQGHRKQSLLRLRVA
jgi:hypothetical protein